MLRFIFFWIFGLLLICRMPAVAQLYGTITDTAGKALPFAAVYIEGTSRGTYSNDEGNYQLELNPGQNRVIYQYVGYATAERIIENQGTRILRDMTLEADENILETVVILADAEDPAYAIIRKAIRAREHFRGKPTRYQATVYQKFQIELLDLPEKIFGIELAKTEEDQKEIDELKDTSQNVLMVSETVSEYFQDGPIQWKEHITSSKISGDQNGYMNMAGMFTGLDFYENFLLLGNKLISPIASSALLFYDYHLMGTFRDRHGHTINKIRVIPKRAYDPVFHGYIFITEDLWNISGIDLSTCSKNTNIDFLDTIHIKQDFLQLSKETTDWAFLSQFIALQVRMFGIKVNGYHTRNITEYDLDPEFPAGLFSHVQIKIDEESNKRDSVYWEKIRPIPLTLKERKGYVKMDSMEQVTSSRSFQDSIDRRSNTFSAMDLISGYHYQNSFRKYSWTISSPLLNVLYNPVQGFHTKMAFNYDQTLKKKQFFKINSELEYGLSDNRLLPRLQIDQMLDNRFKFRYQLAGGSRYVQPGESDVVDENLNALILYFDGLNYLKLYRKDFVQFSLSRHFIPGIDGSLSIGYSRRSALENRSNIQFFTDKPLTPNIFEDGETLHYRNKLECLIRLTYSPGTKYIDNPHDLQPIYSSAPVIFIEYQKSLALNEQFVAFDLLKGGLNGTLQTGLLGYNTYRLEAGGFLSRQRTDLIDDVYLPGNELIFTGNSSFHQNFHLLPFYHRSHFQPYLMIQTNQYFKGLLFSKIPWIRRLKLEEVASVHTFYQPGEQAYFELGLGLDKVFRVFSLRYSWSFRGKEYLYQGLRISMPFSMLNVQI